MTVSQRFRYFLSSQALGGLLVLICSLVAVVWANSPAQHSYHALWHTSAGLHIGSVGFAAPLHLWINDGLMVVFFLLVGLEIKREVMDGELSDFQSAALPVVAAVGGCLVPAGVYFALNAGQPTQRGWAIPMATDIAFVLGIVTLLGSRVPVSLKVMLTALAIVDDLCAVLVIAFFYTEQVNVLPLLGAGAIMGLLILANFNTGRLSVYLPLGVVLWICVLMSGVHATMAGVLVALAIPAKMRISREELVRKGESSLEAFGAGPKEGRRLLDRDEIESLHELQGSAARAEPPLQRLEHLLHPWTTYFIVPLFCLANAGVTFTGAPDWSDPVTLGICLGLVLGKPLGVTLFTWLGVRAGWLKLPPDLTWTRLVGLGALAGVGFTMALFITGLAFSDPPRVNLSKTAILIASLTSAILGSLILRAAPQDSAKSQGSVEGRCDEP